LPAGRPSRDTIRNMYANVDSYPMDAHLWWRQPEVTFCSIRTPWKSSQHHEWGTRIKAWGKQFRWHGCEQTPI
jgi:hypothetical protein